MLSNGLSSYSIMCVTRSVNCRHRVANYHSSNWGTLVTFMTRKAPKY